MTLEELWQLFPIFLTEPNKSWKDWYEEEEDMLRSILSDFENLQFHHIGSTAVPGIWAKPIIDILIEAPDYNCLDAVRERLAEHGYILMADSGKGADLNKGYTESGFADRVFHIHVRLIGDNGELYFRDYLNANPSVAKEYEALKLKLWKQFEHNRDAYTEAKTDFVRKYTALAKEFRSHTADRPQ